MCYLAMDVAGNCSVRGTGLDGLVENTKSHLNGGIKCNWGKDIEPFFKTKCWKSRLYIDS